MNFINFSFFIKIDAYILETAKNILIIGTMLMTSMVISRPLFSLLAKILILFLFMISLNNSNIKDKQLNFIDIVYKYNILFNSFEYMFNRLLLHFIPYCKVIPYKFLAIYLILFSLFFRISSMLLISFILFYFSYISLEYKFIYNKKS